MVARWKRIAFNSNLTGDHVMYIVNVDGFGLVDLSSVGEGWQFDFCAPGLFVMRADGKGIEALPVDGIGETSLPGWR